MQVISQMLNKISAQHESSTSCSVLTKIQSRYLIANSQSDLVYPGSSNPPVCQKVRYLLNRYGAENYWRLSPNQRTIEEGMVINTGSLVNYYTLSNVLIMADQTITITKCNVFKHDGNCGGHIVLPSSFEAYRQVFLGRDIVNPRSFFSGMILTPQGCFPDYPYVHPVVLLDASVCICASPFIKVAPCRTYVPKCVVPSFIASSFSVHYTQQTFVLSVTLSSTSTLKLSEHSNSYTMIPIVWSYVDVRPHYKCVFPRSINKMCLRHDHNQSPADLYKGFLSHYLINQYPFISYCHKNYFPSLSFAIGSMQLSFEESDVLSIVDPYYSLSELDSGVAGNDFDFDSQHQAMILGFQSDLIAEINACPLFHPYYDLYAVPAVKNTSLSSGLRRTNEYVMQECVEAHRFVSLLSCLKLASLRHYLKNNMCRPNDFIFSLSRIFRFLERIILSNHSHTCFLDYLNLNALVFRLIQDKSLMPFLKDKESLVPKLTEIIILRSTMCRPPCSFPSWSLFRDNPLDAQFLLSGQVCDFYFTSCLDPSVFDGPLKGAFIDYFSNFSIGDFLAVFIFLLKRGHYARLSLVDYYSLLHHYAIAISGYNTYLPVSIYYQLFFFEYFKVRFNDGNKEYFDSMRLWGYESVIDEHLKSFKVEAFTDHDFPH
jgi:hypothetical protein